MNRESLSSVAVGTATLAAALVAGLSAQAPALDIKLGFWETTTVAKVDMGGAPPIDTSKMTAQQKARMEEAMKAMSVPHTDTQRRCITRADIGKSFFPDANKGCTDKITANTARLLDLTRTCSGSRNEVFQVHMEALSRESLKGAVNSTATVAGRAQKMNITFTSKWIGADCKPKP